MILSASSVRAPFLGTHAQCGSVRRGGTTQLVAPLPTPASGAAHLWCIPTHSNTAETGTGLANLHLSHATPPRESSACPDGSLAYECRLTYLGLRTGPLKPSPGPARSDATPSFPDLLCLWASWVDGWPPKADPGLMRV